MPVLPIEAPAPSVATPSGYAIEFDNVSIAFDEKVVLQNISFHLAHGETKAVFGVAGSGKSTMLKMAMGLLRPDSGRIFVLGDEVTQMSEDELFELRRRVGIVFQESALFDSFKVWENVGFRLLEEHVHPDEIERRVREVLRFVELERTYDMEACAAASPSPAPSSPNPRCCSMIPPPAASTQSPRTLSSNSS
jgi:phospholipid/cholesterol/gamma-HCH transport system ATP-binding protein